MDGKNSHRLAVTERHVQAIWYDRDLRPENICTREGERVRVVYPGEWNASSGPDFKGAVLEVGEKARRVVGDVEVHLMPADWEAHAHGRDAAYRNVVAHVTWCDGAPPLSLPKGALSIWLGRFLADDVSFSPGAIDLGVYPFGRMPVDERPCRKSAGQNPDCAQRVLTRSGVWRLKAKSSRMAARLKKEDFHQVFYSEFMRALGYGKNADAFSAIAAAIPYSVWSAERENLAAIFQSAASFVEWNRDRTRPGNSPERRLAAAARLLGETDVMTLAETRDVSPASCRRIMAKLTANGVMGRGRAAAIVANVIIPFALARQYVNDVPVWLPPEDVCLPVRRVANRMFGGDHNPRTWYATNGLLIQGLIQIDREWCTRLHPVCTGCGTCAA